MEALVRGNGGFQRFSSDGQCPASGPIVVLFLPPAGRFHPSMRERTHSSLAYRAKVSEHMNSFAAELKNIITTQLGQDLFLEVDNASGSTLPPVSVTDLSMAFATSTGLVRSRNEDRLAVAQVSAADGEVYFVVLVCDGVGGTSKGDLAASIAVTVFLDELIHNRSNIPVSLLLPRLVRHVDEQVRVALKGEGATTLSVFLARGNGDVAATNVGDSRIYAWTPLKDRFLQISRDDTLENELSDLAKDPTALRFHGLRGSLSQAIGEEGRGADQLRVKLLQPEQMSDGIVLATDGAWKGAEDGFMAFLKKAPSASAAVNRVMSLASWSGGVDNASIVAIEKVKDAVLSIPRFAPDVLKLTAWLGNSKIVLTARAEKVEELPSSSQAERRVLKSDIRKAMKRKYPRAEVGETEVPKQLDFKITDDTKSSRKKEPRAKIEISIDTDQDK